MGIGWADGHSSGERADRPMTGDRCGGGAESDQADAGPKRIDAISERICSLVERGGSVRPGRVGYGPMQFPNVSSLSQGVVGSIANADHQIVISQFRQRFGRRAGQVNPSTRGDLQCSGLQRVSRGDPGTGRRHGVSLIPDGLSELGSSRVLGTYEDDPLRSDGSSQCQPGKRGRDELDVALPAVAF